MGCGPEGRVGLALQEKHRTAANRAFSRLARGDVVAVDGTEPRGDGLALVEGSSVRKVVAGGAGARLLRAGRLNRPGRADSTERPT